MKKSVRQARIEQIIKQHSVATQESLLALLKEEGIPATQATISRDIREMQIVKERDANGTIRYTIYHNGEKSEEERLADTLAQVALSITRIEFVNVIRTAPSNGNLLAAIIDDMKLDDVAGTIAGHDTILVISPSETAAQEINDYFRDKMQQIN
ncbi:MULTISPECIES: arginine repressor [Loigolactobacillus]|uniref:Arginine repressor n=1 Tax=Loigolactobacillus backii TaxID=375175 RepID=A0A192H1K3_9LACO|nr:MULTISPECIES: arginine repressor [Loigolactobacillus]ANK59276.1 ArgR family transcriptional regulator [Loigolactobacillus backii]ANK62689.1 ArgR family transcriptional regulator [Loigolactobacillus backii]ANK64268.1 ArgR family transcriptional regulator [Loigolactobacillus backii]ANK67338.1 ArgR family transcriptional regulator [Loigolactobacillus backii]ANK70303.1 ArgR family transcriptional regulator [Loigolactobacillus backii]